MRTTVTIDDDLLKRAKREALERGQTLGEVIEDALRDRLSGRPMPQEPFRFRLVTSGGTGPSPAIDLSDNAAVRDIMDGLV
jgi:hypothetical protein